MSCEAEYFSKDFGWEELRAEIEANPCFRYHLLPFEPSSSLRQAETDVNAWEQFHSRHSSGKFFKERRYLVKEFPELLFCGENAVLEVGCGNGSTALPILRLWSLDSKHEGIFFERPVQRCVISSEFDWLLLSGVQSGSDKTSIGAQAILIYAEGTTPLKILCRFFANKDVIVYACDCSSKSLERAQEVIGSATIDSFEDRFRTFCCDVSTNGFPQWLACNYCRNKILLKQSNCMSESKEGNEPRFANTCSPEECDGCIGGVNFVTLIFTLSAVPVERMLRSITECFAVLKPGGMVFFRDYGLYDMTMLRFEQAKRVGFREYKRSDGTRSYFFCLDAVRDLFVGAGFTELELDYCCVKSVNRQQGKSMRRVWVHGKFQKPALV